MRVIPSCRWLPILLTFVIIGGPSMAQDTPDVTALREREEWPYHYMFGQVVLATRRSDLYERASEGLRKVSPPSDEAREGGRRLLTSLSEASRERRP